jgi:hypothetical protein
MKQAFVIELVVFCVLLSGCETTAKKPPVNERLMNAGLINAFNDAAMENAIIAQHTLYPYHFVNNSEKLNDLGRRDLSILARHFKEYPGQLNISGEGTDENIYQARLAYVSDMLKKDGIDVSKVAISDGLPGGDGMNSVDVLQIKEADQKARNERRQSYPVTDTDFSSSTR